MGLKRKGKGPFRGPAPPKVYQTVDVGTGEGQRLESIARKFPNRNYVAVDPALHEKHLEGMGLHRNTVERLTQAGVEVRPQKLRIFIDRMKRQGQKTRYVNIDMPAWGTEGYGNTRWIDRYGFRKLFANARHILLPNGKIFIKTENQHFAEWLKKLAEKHGLKTRPLLSVLNSDIAFSRQGRDSIRDPPVPPAVFAPIEQLMPEKLKIMEEKIKARNKKKARGQWPSFGGHPVTHYMYDKYGFYILEITYGLKKAIPNQGKRGDVKAQRRKWPES